MTDEQIQYLLNAPKRVMNAQARWKDQRGSRQKNYDVETVDGNHRFRLFLRQNKRLESSFSCGLHYLASGSEDVCLTRYNGDDHDHSNPLESASAMNRGFHIHRATERYIQAGRKAEHFAESTDRYSTLEGALQAICADCKIAGLSTQQVDFFL